MSDNWFDSLMSTLGSDFESVKNTLEQSLESLAMNELKEFVPQVYNLLLYLGESNPVTTIINVATKLATTDSYTLVVNELTELVAPLTGPIQATQQHKSNMASVLQTHWDSIHSRADQLLLEEDFSGEGATGFNQQHQSLKGHAQGLHDHIVNTSVSDKTFLTNTENALSEHAHKIANSGPIGAFAFLAAMQVAKVSFSASGGPGTTTAPGTTSPSTSSPGDYPNTGPLDPTTGPLEAPPPSTPWYVEVLEWIAAACAAIDIVVVGTLLAVLALLLFSFYMIWLNAQPPGPRQLRKKNTNTPRPVPAPTPVHPTNSTDAEKAKKIAEEFGVDAATIEQMFKDGYKEEQIRDILRRLKNQYGKKKLQENLELLLAAGATPANTVSIAKIITDLKLKNLDASIIGAINEFLTTDLGNDETFTEADAAEFFKNLTSIYGTSDNASIISAMHKILAYNWDQSSTIIVSQELANIYKELGTDKNGRAKINTILDSLSFKNINARPFRGTGLARHAGPTAKPGHDHMAEMGASTPKEYEQKAIDFMKGAPNGDEVQLERPSGEIVRYNTQTHEFGIVEKDGSIETYYKVDKGSDAEDYHYFLQQALQTGSD